MGILVEEEVRVSSSKDYKFSSVAIRRDFIKGLIAVVTFDVLDDTGKKISEKKLVYTDTNYNTFWDGFNSGKFLYEELITKEGIQAQAPSEIEDEFKNS